METVKIIFDGEEVEIPMADLEWFQQNHEVEVVKTKKEK
jgi:hypothetical protein